MKYVIKCSIKQTCSSLRFGRSERGDVTIAGLFDLHDKGEGRLECSNRVNPSSFQALEAFYWAIDRINKNDRSLTLIYCSCSILLFFTILLFIRRLLGVKLSGVTMDSCRSKSRSVRGISSLLSADQEMKVSSILVTLTKNQTFYRFTASGRSWKLYVGCYNGRSSVARQLQATCRQLQRNTAR